MNQPLRILLVEESEDDATLLLNQLENQGGYDLASQRVETITDFKAALGQSWDIVIADYDSKQLGYSQALQLLRETKLDLPLIVISAEIGAEAAARAMKAGANDVVTKANFASLRDTVERELREVELRRSLRQAEAKYQSLFENAVVGIFQTTPDGHYISANPALAKIYGYQSSADMMAHITDIERQLYVNPNRRHEFASLMEQHDSVSEFESQIYRKDGSVIWILENARVVRDESGKVLYYEGFVEDVTERYQVQAALRSAKQDLEVQVQKRTAQLRQANEKLQKEIWQRNRAEALLARENQVLELILRGTPLKEALEAIARAIEELSEDIKCCFLLSDPNDSKLHYGAAPSLPDEYNQAMDGVVIGSCACSCCTAAYRREAVIVEDIATDPFWADKRDLALAFGLRACWSMPILTRDGQLLGTFAIYYSQPCTPSDYEKQLIIKATHLAGIAIERDRQEIELNKSRVRFQQLTANIPGIIYQFQLKPDGSYSFPFISPSCYEICELGPEEIQRNPGFALSSIHPSDRASFEESVAYSAQTLQPWQWEGRITIPSGKVKWMKGAARPELQPNSDILWDGLMMDITELKGTQEALERSEAKLKQQATELTDLLHELQRAQLQLVQTEKMSSLGQLVAGIAHEINNPVSFIYGNLNYACEYIEDILNLLDLYQQHYPQPVPDIQAQSQTFDLEFVRQDLPKILSSMKLGTDRICQIVRSLRNFSRLDQTKVQTVDIHEMIDSTVLILQHRLKASGGKPAIDIIREYGDLPLVECYPGQLNQVFMNLIANAIDALEESFISQRAVLNGVHSKRSANQTLENPKSAFSTNSQGTSENAQIKIRTQVLEDNSHVLILIADNGPGISLEHQNEIFDAFFTTKPVGKGTGLGLSISYQIVVEKHQGLLKCFSEPGRGTEFWIQIPIMANG